MKTLLLMMMAGLTFAITPDNKSCIDNERTVSFDLLNKSLTSIPLKIPGVMNPNLSPMSRSGVSLKVGQKIFFSYKGKKRILLVVDTSLEGQQVVVDQLIKARKREIRNQG
jgi:hypothetical protein